jgi:hypothetical protein
VSKLTSDKKALIKKHLPVYGDTSQIGAIKKVPAGN